MAGAGRSGNSDREAFDGSRSGLLDRYRRALLSSPELRRARQTFVLPQIITPLEPDRAPSAEGASIDLAETLKKSRVIILGDVGAGKTALLRAIAFDYASCWDNEGNPDVSPVVLCDERRLPVYVRLKPSSTASIEQQIAFAIGEATGDDVGLAETKKLLHDEKLLVLFDEFGSVALADQIETLHALTRFTAVEYPGQGYAIALRAQDFPLLQAWFKEWPTAAIQPLDDRQVASLVSHLLHDKDASALLQRLASDDDWWEMGRNPLILSTACAIAESLPSTGPAQNVVFLARLIQKLLARLDETTAMRSVQVGQDHGAYRSFLASAALETMREPAATLDLDADDAFPRRLIDSGILEMSVGAREATFRNPLFQQFFGALAIENARANGLSIVDLTKRVYGSGFTTETSFCGRTGRRHGEGENISAWPSGARGRLGSDLGVMDDPAWSARTSWQKSIIFYVLQSADKHRLIAELAGDGRAYVNVLLAAQCLIQTGDESYRELVAIQPANVDLYRQYGRAFRQLKRHRQAQQALADAVKLDPHRASVRQELAEVLVEQGKLDAAAGEYEAALRLSGDELGYRLGLANIQAQRGNLAEAWSHVGAGSGILARIQAELSHQKGHLHEAENDLAAALREHCAAADLTGASHYWFHVGAIYRRAGKLEEAEATLQRAISHHFDDVDAHRELGALLEDRGDLPSAVREYRNAAHFRRTAALSVDLGRVYRKLGRLAQADAELRQAISLDPALAEAFAELGLVCEKRGDVEGALERYRQALRIRPDVAVYYQRLGWLLKALGRPADAETELAIAVKLDQDKAEYREQLGAVFADAGRYAEALEQYEIAASLRPADPAYRHHTGAIHARLGNYEAAIAALSLAIELCAVEPPGAGCELSETAAPESLERSAVRNEIQRSGEQPPLATAEIAAEAHGELGLLYEKLEKWHEALLHYRSAADLVPFAKVYWLRQGLVHRQLEQMDDASKALRHAAALAPEDAEIRAALGSVREASGDLAGALEEYRKACALMPDRISFVLSAAQVYRQLGRHAEAREFLTASLGRRIDSAALRCELAVACLATGDPDAALEQSIRAIVLDPGSAQSHLTHGRSLFSLARWDEALQELMTAVAIDPGIAEAHFHLARLHERRASLAEARACAVRAVALASDEMRYAFLAGHLCAALGRTDEALEHLTRATASAEALPCWHAELGELLESGGRLEEALAAFQRAARLDPTAPQFLRAGLILLALERYAEAAETLLRALSLAPSLADAHAALGEVLLRTRQPSAAVERFARACELRPEEADYWAGMASAYLALHALPEAAGALQRALALNPANAGWQNQIGKITRSMGKWDVALSLFEKAVSLAPLTPDYAHDVAMVHSRAGRYDNACRWLRHALSREDRFCWREGLGDLLAITGDLEGALAEYEALASRAPAVWRFQRKLGLLYLQSGRPGDALRALETARDLCQPDDVDALTHYALGRAYVEVGHLAAALKEQTLAVQMAPDSAAAHTALGAARREMLAAGDSAEACRPDGEEYRLAAESLTRALALDPDFAEAHHQLGQMHELAGDIASAVREHRRAAALDPAWPPYISGAAAAYVKMRDLEKAQALILDGLQKVGHNPLLLNQLGLIYEARVLYSEALDAFEHAAALAPSKAVYRYNAGRAHLLLNDETEARRDIEAAVRMKPTERYWRKLLAHLHERLGEWDRAVDECTSMLQLEPGDRSATLALGRALAGAGRLDESVEHLQRAAAVAPSAGIFDQLAVVKRQQGQLREALRYSQQALRREPNDHVYQLNLALTWKALGQVQKATDEIRRIASETPNLVLARYQLGVCLEEEGKLQEALQEYLWAAEKAPRKSVYGRAAARAHRLLGQFSQAVAMIERTARLAPGDPEVFAELARIEQARGNLDEALRHCRQAISMQNKPAFHCDLALVLRQMSRLGEAIAEMRATAAAEPRNPRWQNVLGQLLEEQGNVDDAIKRYHEALRLDPQSAELHHNLGVALKKQGKLDEAIQELQRALDIKPDYTDAYRHLTAASASQLLRKTMKKGN